MRVVLEIEADKWEFLKPSLGRYQITELGNGDPIDFTAIRALKNGARIERVLKKPQWDSKYTLVAEYQKTDTWSGGRDSWTQRDYAVLTNQDLFKLSKSEFMRCRDIGLACWNELEAYINKLKQKYDDKED